MPHAFLNAGTQPDFKNWPTPCGPRICRAAGEKWLTRFTPFFTDQERPHAGCRHRLFFSQVEYCDNLIFHRRAALDELGARLLDAHRTIGQPTKITVIFDRKVTKRYRGAEDVK